MMNILVSGGSGFIGSNLIPRLIKNNHSVTAICNKNDIENNSIKKIVADISNPNFSIPDETFDLVYHFAAATPFEKDKKIQKAINYEGTVNLFEKIKNRTKFLIYSSGTGAFGDIGENTINENTPINPHTDFAKIRLKAQKYLEEKCKENNIPFTVTYFGDVYGNGGWFKTQIIKRLKEKSFRLPKGGNFIKSFVHIDDVVSALIAIGTKEPKNDSYIIADSNPVTFKEFINFTADQLDVKHPGSVPAFLAKTVLGGDMVKLLTTQTKCDNSKMAKLTELKFPSYKEGVSSTIAEINNG